METRTRRASAGGALASRNPNAAEGTNATQGGRKPRLRRSRASAATALDAATQPTVAAPAAGRRTRAGRSTRAAAPAAAGANANGSGSRGRGVKRRRSRAGDATTTSQEGTEPVPEEATVQQPAGADAPAPAKKARVDDEDEDPSPTHTEDVTLPAASAAGAAPAVARPAPAAAYTDIDEQSKGDALYFYQYAPHIYDHMKELETRYGLNPNYCTEVQAGVKPKMRAVLVDWLVEVIEEYRLLPESLYASVQYVDRYLSVKSIERPKLQLLGCACMLIAAKFEEMYMPMLDEFVYLTDQAYSREDIIAMEGEVLTVLGWHTKVATSKSFMTRYLHAAGAGKWDMTTNITKYLCELALLEYRFLAYRPSRITAAAVLLARRLQRMPVEWTTTLEHYTGYTAADLLPVMWDLAALQNEAASLPIETVYQKYTHSPYMRVATTLKPIELPDGFTPPVSCAKSLKGNTY